jgi:hypothetical protein
VSGDARVTVDASAGGHKCLVEEPEDDLGLARIQAAWNGLSPDLKRSVLAIIGVAESRYDAKCAPNRGAVEK